MTRAGLLVAAVASMTTGCDRVFGLVEGGGARDGGADGTASDGRAGDGASDGATSNFCGSLGGPPAQYCFDFEDPTEFGSFGTTTESGSIMLSTAQARSPVTAFASTIDFSTVLPGADPRAFVTIPLDTSAPITVIDVSVYIASSAAQDMAFLTIVMPGLATTLFTSGTVDARTATETMMLPPDSTLVRDQWVDVEVTFTSGGVIDVQYGSGPPGEIALMGVEPSPTPTLRLGLHQSVAPALRGQGQQIVFFDNLVAR